jgi:hypothetical protein
MCSTASVRVLLVCVALVCPIAADPLSAQDAPRPPGPPAGQVPAGPGRIDGSIVDAAGTSIAGVGITVRSAADSAMVTGVLTEANGRFRIDGLPVGRYLLRVSMIGYRPRNSEVIDLTPADPARDLGRIELETAPVQLDALEADVERSAVVVEADRTVYNTAAMPVAAGGTATDVLRAVPELEVDVNNNVKLRGNQEVAVHLNGRPAPLRGEQLANFLQQLPGNRIARVEVLPNPSAKHDPEGMGGIVNIVLKDNLDLGLSGSVTASMSTRNRQFLNGRLNYQRGRLTLFSGAGANLFNNRSTNYDLRRNLVTNPVSIIEQNSSSVNDSRGWNLDWTAELKVGKQATLWSNAWMFSNGSDGTGTTEYGILDEDRTVNDRYDRTDDTEFTFGNYNFGAGFKQVFQPQKEELTVDGRYTRGVNDRETTQLRLFHVLARQPVDQPLEMTLNEIDSGYGNMSIQADYSRPLGAARLELGYRAWRRDQDNDNLLRVFETVLDNDPLRSVHSGYEYEEIFHSLYGSYGRTFGRFGVQGGLRAENTSTRFESLVASAAFDRSYSTLFPSFNVSYTPKPGRTARFLYSKRISRPPPFYLDPFVPSTDPLNVMLGNVDLRPSYTQQYSLDFSYTGSRGTVRVAPYYRHSTDVWERIRTVDTDAVATSRWENGQSAKAYGSNFTLSLRSGGRLSGSGSFNLYQDVRDGTNISSAYRRSAFMWSMGGNAGLKLSQSLTAQVNANHFPTQSILQGRASGYTFSSLALRQQIWGTKGTISLNVSDPLNLMQFTSATRDATYIQNSRTNQRFRMATLGFTYNFGKPPQQQSRRSGPEEAGETIRVR